MRRVPVSIRVFVALLGLTLCSAVAKADCVSACQAATYCDSEMNASGECGRRLNDCYINECSKKLFGAIAYGTQSGATGWSYDFEDGSAAESEALKKCGADDCEVVVDFWNSCAAVAASGDVVRYGLGDTEDEAQGDAVTTCEKDGGTQCAVQAWSCTSNSN